MTSLETAPSHLGSEAELYVPPVPQTIEETGLSPSLLEQLIMKLLYFEGEQVGRDLAKSLGLKFSLIASVLDFLKRSRQVEVKRSSGFGDISAVFALSEVGRGRSREYLDINQYSGRAPVPIDQYMQAVRSQRAKDGWLTKQNLFAALQHLVIEESILSQIGPAVNSGKSFLIYGKPGNGKTYLAEGLQSVEHSSIYIPYAIEAQGMIIHMFDRLYHRRVDEQEDSHTSLAFEPHYDFRWARCRRPFIVTGGELTLDMLDLSYNPSAKVYDAPFQLKANNGIYLIDDFGRQKASPAELLNRWIIPMDRHVDYLTFHTGGKVAVPFEAFLIFSTNLHPDKLGDEAFLRRIQYKMHLKSPDEREFIGIFERYCRSENMPFNPQLLSWFVDKYYHQTDMKFRRSHPRDIISHAIDLIRFESLPFELSPEVLERAFASCFLEASQIAE